MNKKKALHRYRGVRDDLNNDLIGNPPRDNDYKNTLYANESDFESNSSGGEDLFKDPRTRTIETRIGENRRYEARNNYEQDPKYGSVAPLARVKNPIMIQRVKHAIETITRRKMTMGEQVSLRNFISQLPTAKLAQYNDTDIEKNIVNNWLKGQTVLNGENEVIDTHELLKKNIGLNSENGTVATSISAPVQPPVITNAIDLSSVLGNTDSYGIQRIINPQALHAKTQILLDSRWRSLDTDGTLLFKWSFSNTMTTQQGTFNTLSPIRDIIAIKIFPFKIPYTVNAENPTRNITVFYNEFSNQCVPAQENRKYHHWMDYNTEDDWISLNADKYNEGTYNFDKPITTLDTLTINFGAPLQIIQFDIDRMNATFTAGNPTTLTFPSAHNIENGNTIYFTNFTTTNVAADAAIISAMNTVFGLDVTRIDSTTVTVNVDTSAIVGTMNSPIAFFGDKRIFIPLEITYIKPKS